MSCSRKKEIRQKLLMSDDRTLSEHTCVHCGYCCTVGTCTHGKWCDETKQCAYLTKDNMCAKYERIVLIESRSRYPMMGCGCSSPLGNDRRNEKIRMMHKQRKE
jgi:hypothetical protein